jgi:hypothetical protein
MFLNYRLKVLFVLALIYFGGHVLYGSFYCASNFCPGDSESDWVYEYSDDDGKRYIVVEGKKISKEEWDRNLGTVTTVDGNK